MADKEYVIRLENVIKQMLTPLNVMQYFKNKSKEK